MLKTLLLTGYEPFLKFKTNPTESAVKSLDGGKFKLTSETSVCMEQGETVQ